MKTKLSILAAGTIMGTMSFPVFGFGSPSDVKPNNQEARVISKEGILSCWHSRRRDAIQMIELKTSDDNETIKLVDYEENLQALCPPSGQESSAKIQVKGEYTSRFLFWGGNLRVRSFNVSPS